MGPMHSKPFSDVTKEELASFLEHLGPNFVAYSQAVRDDAVDWEFLCSLDARAFAHTLDDLHVSRLHQRLLTKEWKKALQQRTPACIIDADPDIDFTRPTGLLEGDESEHEVFSWRMPKETDALVENPKFITDRDASGLSERERKIFDALSAYDLSPKTDSSELEVFGRIADRILKECNALYAGVHLLDTDGHLSLSSRAFLDGDRESEPSTERRHAPIESSQCWKVILAGTDDFIVEPIGRGQSPFNKSNRESKYVSCVTVNKEGLRVGVVCAVLDRDDTVVERIVSVLKELAVDVMLQLELRRIFLERDYSLIDMHMVQIRALSRELADSKAGPSVVLPSFGPISAVTSLDIDRRERSPFPMPEEIVTTGKPARTAMLPVFHNEDCANDQERRHLPDDYHALGDAMGVDRTPVHKNDIERVAAVEAFELKEIPFDDPTGVALKRITVSCMHSTALSA
jgi:hypothetical protein